MSRQLAHQTDDIANEILKRFGVGPVFARALGAGLRLYAEAYSRMPFVPSPLPETSAPGARRAR